MTETDPRARRKQPKFKKALFEKSQIETPLDEIIKKVKETFFTKLLGKVPFRSKEISLTGEEKKQGVTIKPDGEILFDKESLDRGEIKTLEQFLQEYKTGGIEAIKKSARFGWYLENQPDDFVEKLAKRLEKKKFEIASHSTNLKSASLSDDVEKEVEQATKLMRDMAKREQIRKALKDQFKKLPIAGFRATDGVGNDVDLYFNPNDINDPKNEVDLLFTNTTDGKPELLVIGKRKDITNIRPLIQGKNANDFRKAGKFEVGRFTKEEFENDEDGDNFSNRTCEVSQGGSQTAPLFSRIRILMKPTDFDKKLDELGEERRQRDEQEAFKKAKRQARTYAPPPVSAPTTPAPRWQKSSWEQDTYVSPRSG